MRTTRSGAVELEGKGMECRLIRDVSFKERKDYCGKEEEDDDGGGRCVGK